MKSLVKDLRAIALIGVLFNSSLCLASEINVHDCAGNLRATSSVEEGEKKGLKFILETEEKNSKAKLVNIKNDSSFAIRAKEEQIVFSAIDSGDWKICKEDGSSIAFNTVEFIDSDSSTLKVASLVAGGAALVSGVAIASGDSGNDDGNNNFSQPTEPDRTITEKPQSSLQPGQTERPGNEVLVESRCDKKKPATLAATSNDCREDEDAPIISPYS